MDMCEVQEIIRKRITVIKKTIIRPLGFDIILKIPKKGISEDGEEKNDRDKKAKHGHTGASAAQQKDKVDSQFGE